MNNDDGANYCVVCNYMFPQPTSPPEEHATQYHQPVQTASPNKSILPIIEAIVTIVAVVIIIVLLMSPITSPFDTIRDSDGDGISNASDFYDYGNGQIKISITSYQGDGTADFWTSGDPYFVIKVDEDLDGIYDYSKTTSVHVDSEYFTNSQGDSFTVDINDDISKIKFQMLVYDDDELNSPEPIDYCEESTGTFYTHTVNAPYSNSFSYNGSLDGGSGIDCILEYKIEVVGD